MGKIVIVNEDDEPIGTASYEEVVKTAAIRRISRIFLIGQDRRLFLQKRGPNVFYFPNLWDQSAGGHVDEGETYEMAARRELFEELGLPPSTPMYEVCKFYMAEPLGGGKEVRTWSTVFRAEHDGSPIRYQKSEVATGKWLHLDEVATLMAKNPEEFTPAFIRAFEEYQKLNV